MKPENGRRVLLGALACLALGGLLLHLRVHPVLAPDKGNPSLLVFRPSLLPATLLPLLDLVVVTALFSSRRTAAAGYLLNGLIIIYGSVLMAHHSIATLAPKGPALADWFLRSTFPDVAIAFGDFLVGKALFESWVREA